MDAAAGAATWIGWLAHVRWGVVGVIGLDVLLWALIIEMAQLAVAIQAMG